MITKAFIESLIDLKDEEYKFLRLLIFIITLPILIIIDIVSLPLQLLCFILERVFDL